MPVAGLPAGPPVTEIGPAPSVGEHSRIVLTEFGYGAAEVDALIAGGVVGQAPGSG
jgi:hypothetical protein